MEEVDFSLAVIQDKIFIFYRKFVSFFFSVGVIEKHKNEIQNKEIEMLHYKIKLLEISNSK